MATTLVQKHLFKGTYRYEIVSERLNVHIKTPFSEVTRSFMLAELDPEPVINKSHLEFVSRVNGEALITLMLARPDSQAFNEFVNTLKQQVLAGGSAFPELMPTGSPEGLAANVYEEPPDFDEDFDVVARVRKDVNIEEIDTTIRMLQTYLEPDQTGSLITALEALRAAPESEDRLDRVASVFSELGANQGAVLTYAPYLATLLSDNAFGRG
jgi:hypothetical protein